MVAGEPYGLLQQDGGARRGPQHLEVELDDVAEVDLLGQIGRDDAVHLHPTLADQALDLAPRAEAGGGDVAVQADRQRGGARYALA